MGNAKVTYREKVVVASVQSLGSERLSRFSPGMFDLVVCDEAHHSAAPSYKQVFDHFGFFTQQRERLLLGVTATPFRTDGNELFELFGIPIYQMSILKAIEDGWLTDIRGIRVQGSAKLDRVHTRSDDFVQPELS